MSSNKNPETGDSVGNFIDAVDNEQKRKNSWYMIAMMKICAKTGTGVD